MIVNPVFGIFMGALLCVPGNFTRRRFLIPLWTAIACYARDVAGLII